MNNLIVIIALFLSVVNSCNDKNEKNINSTSINKWLGKKIIVPSDTLNIKIKNSTTFNYSNLFKSDHIKLIVAINGECGTCVYKLKIIEDFADRILSLYGNISLLVYVNSATTDFYNFEIMNDNEIKFKYPLLYDYENRYLRENKFPSNDFYYILLCDEDDKVLMIGDFTKNLDLENLYLKQIEIHASPLFFDYPTTPRVTKTPIKIP